MKKLSVKEQKELISDDAVREAFMQREDIAPLPKKEREARWQKHLVGLNRFREFLSDIPAFVIPAPTMKNKAFSLIELLIVLAVFAVVAFAIHSCSASHGR